MWSERLEFIKRHGVIIVVVTIRMNCEYQRSSLGKPLPKHATERVTEETQISSRTSTKLIQRAGDSDGGQRAEDSDEGQKCCGQM